MTRTVDIHLLRRLRQEKDWSQEELAVAAGLSSRTVQRLEAEGKGSIASIKSVASALEVSTHSLQAEPTGQRIGVRSGYAGVIAGTACALAAIGYDWMYGGGTAHSAGVSFGIVGLLVGLSCGFIGWASARVQ
ncbi:MAG: helix-turn-helix transcriptional regulator [Pseudomonadota bacterium]